LAETLPDAVARSMSAAGSTPIHCEVFMRVLLFGLRFQTSGPPHR
jgi:hypothetical protein